MCRSVSEHRIIAIIFLAVLFGVVGCEQSECDLDRIVNLYSSHDPAERARLQEHLSTLRASMIEKSMRIIQESTDNQFGGEVHEAMLLVGKWRMEEAVPILASRIDFALDPQTVPVGARHDASALYPAINALRQIGGQTTRAAMLQKIQEPGEDRLITLYAYVLSAVEGPEAARVHLAIAAQGVGYDAARGRCEIASELIASGIRLHSPAKQQHQGLEN